MISIETVDYYVHNNVHMAKAPRAGRPPKPARLRRTQRLQLLLTQAERRELNEYVMRRNVSASELIRGCLRSLLENEAAKGNES